MTARRNPFEFVAANDLPEDDPRLLHRGFQLLSVHLVQGQRHPRGRTRLRQVDDIALQQLAPSYPQAEQEDRRSPLDLIGVYIPCNTPLIHKQEYQLVDALKASVIAEHHFVLSIAFKIAETLKAIPDVMKGADEQRLRSKIEFIFGTDLPANVPFFDAIMDFVDRECVATQRAVIDRHTQAVEYENTYTFASLVIPLLGCTRTIPCLQESHFMLLIDDAHDLNRHQAEGAQFMDRISRPLPFQLQNGRRQHRSHHPSHRFRRRHSRRARLSQIGHDAALSE